MHPCERVGVDLAITPEQLFEVLSDAQAWPQWAELIARRAPR